MADLKNIKKHLPQFKAVPCLQALLGSAILAFGMYNIHSVSGVTEGGILGLTLLGEHWLDLSPAVSGFLLNAVCYVFGWKTLGRDFIGYSAIAGGGFSVFYALFEQFPAVYPQIAQMPLVAAFVGALFVGLGAGLCVRAGGAPCGDDALAMALSARLTVRIQWVYLVSDLLVLGLSLTYIPFNRIAYSLLTVVLSGQLIGFVQRFKVKK